MKGLICICFLLTVACSHEIRISEEDLVAGVFYTEGSYRPFTGKCIVTSAQGNIVAAELTYQHGYLDGEAKVLYPNGKTRKKGNFREGELSGTWQFWDESGKKTAEYTFGNRR